MPSAEVNSVMMSPHPPRSRMKRRKTVSVTPAMGARTVAGAICTSPIFTRSGTGEHARARTPASTLPELSQYLRTVLILPPSPSHAAVAQFLSRGGYDLMDDTPRHFVQELRS